MISRFLKVNKNLILLLLFFVLIDCSRHLPSEFEIYKHFYIKAAQEALSNRTDDVYEVNKGVAPQVLQELLTKAESKKLEIHSNTVNLMSAISGFYDGWMDFAHLVPNMFRGYSHVIGEDFDTRTLKEVKKKLVKRAKWNLQEIFLDNWIKADKFKKDKIMKEFLEEMNNNVRRVIFMEYTTQLGYLYSKLVDIFYRYTLMSSGQLKEYKDFKIPEVHYATKDLRNKYEVKVEVTLTAREPIQRRIIRIPKNVFQEMINQKLNINEIINN